MTTLFEFHDALIVKGEDLTETETFEKDYNPFIINRAVSQHYDTILYASEMNKLPFLDKDVQYKFFLYAVPKKKRFSKWAKKENVLDQEVMDAVMDYYEIGLDDALEYLDVLSEDQIKEIMKLSYKGGRAGKQ